MSTEDLKKLSKAYRRQGPLSTHPIDGFPETGSYWRHRNHDPSMRYGGDWTVMFWEEPKDDHKPVSLGRYPTAAKAEQAIWDHWATLQEDRP
jgi:hypothetical protein